MFYFNCKIYGGLYRYRKYFLGELNKFIEF